jgi:pimeloyl-ACP methyl ester carboxylesterase
MQGLSTDREKRVELVLYHADDPSREAGKAFTKWVGPEKSGLDLDFSPSSNDAHYVAKLTSLPAPPIPVYLEGDEAGKEILRKALKENQSIGADLIDFKEGTRYALLAKDGQFILKQRETDLIIQGVKGVLQRTRDLTSPQYSEESANVMLSIFKRVATWERGLALENPHTKFDPTKIDFTFYEVLNDGQTEEPHKGKNDLTLYYVKVGDKYKSVRGRLKARNNTSQSLWFALLHFSRKYGITSLSNVEIDPNEEAIIWGDDPKKNAFGLPKEVNESTDTFKLIVSDKKVDDFLLEQVDLELGKIISSDEERDIVGEEEEQEKIQNDWFTKTIRIKTVRRIDQVNDNKDVALAQGQIVIKKHPAVKANLSLRAAKTADRGVGQDFDFYKAYARYGVEMFDFASPQRGDEAKKNVENILELNDIRDDADLEKNPLEIDVNIPLAENEYILPVATDGEHVFPCGDATKDDKSGFTQVRIDHIPEPDNRRDVVKALKLYFIKTYLKQDNVNQLCWVEFKADGSITRQSSNLANKVAAAQNILLLIHGIIGDTEVMAKGLRLAGLEQKFDLVLTYDYENLSTPIEETAEKLKQQLAAAGLGDADNKKLTLLVHSMGGLVARFFIEQKGGNNMVDHLVMCGTPNNGSPFGKIEAARKLMNILTPLALTYVPIVVPFAGAFLFRLKKVTPTLQQMDPESPFIKALNSSGDPKVRYTILAGDINEYQEPAERSFLHKVLDKVGKGFVFGLLFGAHPHDIAVSVESILGVDGGRNPAPVRKNVPCHHLNYFISAAGQEELKKVEW